MLTRQMITFGQSVRCASVEELPLAKDAGATSVICPPELATAASELGLVPLVESSLPVGGRPHTACAIHVEGAEAVPSMVMLPAAAAAAVRDGAALTGYPLVSVTGDDITAVGAAIAHLRGLLPPTTRVGGEALDARGAAALIAAGAEDLGHGATPAGAAAVSGRREALVEAAAAAGVLLVERPAASATGRLGLPEVLRNQLDAHGHLRPRTPWATGGQLAPAVAPGRRLSADELTRGVRPAIARVLERAGAGERPTRDEMELLFSARGDEVDAVCETADAVRRRICGDTVTYVVTRNIQYTNVCTYRCRFCAFSKGPLSLNLRGKPYLMPVEEVVDRAREAWERGATEVCMQGGIHPDFTGEFYLDVCAAIKRVLPDLHVHAYSSLEIFQGAASLGVTVERFVGMLRDAGLSSLPGTAAEVLDDDVRRIICPDKVTTAEWVRVQEAAAAAGLRSNATIMFGHVDSGAHWANHLEVVRRLQHRTGHLTEFVPLPYVHMGAPLYLRGEGRPGPTWDEVLLVHAVARLGLQGLVDNIQVSWVKLGVEGAQACLHAGCNDVGGTLMNESISRSAGASHGQEMSPASMEELIRSAGRTPRMRTTLYGVVPDERRAAAHAAHPLIERAPGSMIRLRPASA
ncbi:MAG TPA: 5-amino-6-(D-ribitylamino)uracil--L-tyrosine 4-hydroxyphenyl transferase CofH [Candidatus Dormibacteraeota bacterium]